MKIVRQAHSISLTGEQDLAARGQVIESKIGKNSLLLEYPSLWMRIREAAAALRFLAGNKNLIGPQGLPFVPKGTTSEWSD